MQDRKHSKRDVLLSVRILALIKLHSLENEITSEAIENEYQLSGGEVREIIHTLREAGEPVGSNSRGYFYARSYAEIEPTCAHFKSRAMSMLAVMNKMAERFTGQQQTIFNV